ncbi:hypothetical protein [Microbacterium cremeum]|uniref:hypothetical protein n=1 Tax=Microbacterium cremeum TaxID=2782169 RepID=UPI00188906E6|nr:hypothetical protein [Microbacterium cremeum]
MTGPGDAGAAAPAPRRRTTHEPAAPDAEPDDETVISARRAEPVPDAEPDDETVISTRRAESIPDDATALSGRRGEPVDEATRLSARHDWPADDATALSVRRGGPGGGSTVGPRRSPTPGADAETESATTSPAVPEVVDDTILRPFRPTTDQPAAATPEPAFGAAQPHRAAYVPTAGDLGDRREPRVPEVVVAPRSQTPSPRSLDRSGGGSPTPGSHRPRRLGARARLLILGAALVVVAVLAAVALVLLLA